MISLDDLPPQRPELGITLVNADLEDNIYPQPKPYVPTEYKGGWIGLTLRTKHKLPAGQHQWENQSNLHRNDSNYKRRGCELPPRHQYNNYWPSWDEESVNECNDQVVDDNDWKFEDNQQSESDHWTTEGREHIPSKDSIINGSTDRGDSRHFDKSDEYQTGSKDRNESFEEQEENIHWYEGSQKSDEYQNESKVYDGRNKSTKEQEENMHWYEGSQESTNEGSSRGFLRTEISSEQSDKGSQSHDAGTSEGTTIKRSWDEIAEAITGLSDEETEGNNSVITEKSNESRESVNSGDSNPCSQLNELDEDTSPCSESDELDEDTNPCSYSYDLSEDTNHCSQSDSSAESHCGCFTLEDEEDTEPEIRVPQPFRPSIDIQPPCPSRPQKPPSSRDSIKPPPMPYRPSIDQQPLTPFLPPTAIEPIVVYVFKALRDIFWCILGP